MHLRYYQPSIGGVDAGACDAPIKIPWPSEVDDLKARINTVVEGMDIGVKHCPQLPPDERKAWEVFIAEWRTFNAKKTPTFGSYGDWVNACTYAKTIDAWRDKLLKYCTLPGPSKIEPPGAINLVKWLTVGGIVLGGVLLLTIYAPEIKAGFKTITGRKK